MLGIKNASGAVEDSAKAVTDLANTTRVELSDLMSQLRTGTQIAPVIIIGTAVIATVALLLAIVAVSRRD